MTIRDTLLQDNKDLLRSNVRLDEDNDKIEFTTWRPLDTGSIIDRLIILDTIVPISIASGS